MRFWNYKSEQFYDLYVKIYDSNFPLEKKKVILKSLFSGEYCLLRITSISKLCYEEYKKNNFKKVIKFKRANKRFVRHQFVTFNETLKEVLDQKFEIKVKKNIPQKSGMGGGSMNAVNILNFFLKAMNTGTSTMYFLAVELKIIKTIKLFSA